MTNHAESLLPPRHLSTRADLTTPALLLDLDLFEGNIAAMAAFTKSAGIDLRPHSKTHKCPEVARRQLTAGAIGISVATIREAEAMTDAGITGLLITSEITSYPGIQRLLNVLKHAPQTMIVIDNALNAQDLDRAAKEAGCRMDVMLDVDPGTRRTGVARGGAAIALAEEIDRCENLRLRGIHCYSGSTAHVLGWEARREHSYSAMSAGVETFQTLKQLGMPLEILSGGSTGTYNIDSSLDAMTELQAGSYVFMDVDYHRIGGQSGPIYEDFAQSLTVLSTVVSRNHEDRATIDAGIKAFATDRTFGPKIKGVEGVTYKAVGDEHGVLLLDAPSLDIRAGDRLEFYPPHCDPTVNLYDRIYCLRGDVVEEVWPVLGRYGN
ncbi:MAG: DSD1 family PLP-dependent enzyme [Acidobacteriota bacterium]